MEKYIDRELKKLLLSNAKNKHLIRNITDKSDLIRDFGYDSIQMLNLLIKIENSFNIEFEDEELSTNGLTIYHSLFNCIVRKLKK